MYSFTAQLNKIVITDKKKKNNYGFIGVSKSLNKISIEKHMTIH